MPDGIYYLLGIRSGTFHRRNMRDNAENVPEWLRGSDKMTSKITSKAKILHISQTFELLHPEESQYK